MDMKHILQQFIVLRILQRSLEFHQLFTLFFPLLSSSVHSFICVHRLHTQHCAYVTVDEMRARIICNETEFIEQTYNSFFYLEYRMFHL